MFGWLSGVKAIKKNVDGGLLLFGRKVTSLLFAVAVAIALSAPALFGIAAESGVDFPDWLAVGVERSAVEGRSYAKFPKITWKRLIEGNFQSGLEKCLSDAVPMRDSVLLGNAALQRSSIALANAPFGFDAYHTYFGSERLYLPTQDALVRTSLGEAYPDVDIDGKLGEFSRGLSSVAERFPDKNFVLFLVDHSYTSLSNPASVLTSRYLTTDDIVRKLGDTLAENENVSVLTRSFDDANSYYAEYYKTDHHWNILGAVRGCNLIREALQQPAFNIGEQVVVGGGWSGTNARSGLLLVEEEASDITYDFGSLEMDLSDGGSVTGDDHSAYYEADEVTSRRFNFYGLYYGDSAMYSRIHAGGVGEAVLVSDSYGNALRRPLAESYETLLLYNDLASSSESEDVTLASRIEDDDARDVIIVACVGNILTLTDRFPGYFG